MSENEEGEAAKEAMLCLFDDVTEPYTRHLDFIRVDKIRKWVGKISELDVESAKNYLASLQSMIIKGCLSAPFDQDPDTMSLTPCSKVATGRSLLSDVMLRGRNGSMRTSKFGNQSLRGDSSAPRSPLICPLANNATRSRSAEARFIRSPRRFRSLSNSRRLRANSPKPKGTHRVGVRGGYRSPGQYRQSHRPIPSRIPVRVQDRCVKTVCRERNSYFDPSNEVNSPSRLNLSRNRTYSISPVSVQQRINRTYSISPGSIQRIRTPSASSPYLTPRRINRTYTIPANSAYNSFVRRLRPEEQRTFRPRRLNFDGSDSGYVTQ